MDKKKLRIFLPSLLFFEIAVISFALSWCSAKTARALNHTVSAFFRAFMLGVSNLFPFSLSELIITISPLLLIFYLFIFFKSDSTALKKRFFRILSFVLIFASLYLFALGIGYYQDIELPEADINDSDVEDTLLYLCKKINEIENEKIPDTSELSEELYSSYKKLSSDSVSLTPFLPRVKEIKFSFFASKARILGVFSFFTSEINVNTTAPDYVIPFTAAHEMAHLFGISGEAEASLYAYIVSSGCENPFIRYSAYLNAFEYVGADLILSDKEKYNEVYYSLPEKARSDMKAYRSFYYGNSFLLGEISDKANGALLDTVDKNGSSDYSEFARLLVSYLKLEGFL